MKFRKILSRMRIKITSFMGKSLSVQRNLLREVPHHFKIKLVRTPEMSQYCQKKSFTEKEINWII